MNQTARRFVLPSLVAGLAAVCLPAAGVDLRLVEAVENRDPAAITKLLDQSVDVNAAQPDGTTALIWAARWDDFETAKRLLAAKANVNAANDYGVTALTLACTNRNSAVAEILVAAGASPDKPQWTGETPLMSCARAGAVEAVRSMIARRGKVNAKTRRGQTALMWAAAQKHAPVVEALIEAGADVNATTYIPKDFNPPRFTTYDLKEHTTGQPDRWEGAETHLDPASSRGGYTPLMFAARSGDVESARKLMASGAKVNVAGPDGPALLVASASGQEKLAMVLLENGADPNAVDGYGITALHWAVSEGLYSISVPRAMATDSLWIRPNRPELVRTLLAKGANPNARIAKGTPPFDFPLFAHPGAITMPQIRHVGATAFFLAAAAADLTSMAILLEGGADPLLPSEESTTPLMMAAGLGRVADRNREASQRALEAIKLLVERGADVNAKAAFGRTALHGAAYMGADDIVQYLVSKGANMNAMDKYGQTPLTIAEGDPLRLVDPFDKRFRQQPRPHKSTAELLLKLGAEPLSKHPGKKPAVAAVTTPR